MPYRSQIFRNSCQYPTGGTSGDDLLDSLHTRQLLRGSAITQVAKGVRHAAHAGQQRAERLLDLRQLRDRQRAQSCSVVGHFPTDDLGALRLALTAVVLARELHRGFHGLRTGIDEEGRTEVARSELGDEACRLDRRRMRHAPVGRVGEGADLLGCRRGDVGAAVTHVDTEQACQTVEVAFAFSVDEVAALTADEHGKVAVPGGFSSEMRAEVTTGTCP
jgi:hypothetical protein